MRLIRFMGLEEAEKYLDGEVLENHTDWSAQAKTASKGFCFFPADPPPETRLHYLSGVVDFDIVAEFEVSDVVVLKKSKGQYRDPDEELPDLWAALTQPVKTFKTTEYSLESYSKKTLRLIRLGAVIMRKQDWAIVWGC